MRYDHAVPAVVLLALFGACSEGPTSVASETDAVVPLMDATTAPTREAFEGFLFFCESGFEADPILAGPTLHWREGRNVGEWYVDNPLIDGIEVNVSEGNVVPAGVVVHLAGTLRPTAFPDGSWDLTYRVDFPSAEGSAKGTGDLQGMSFQFEAFPAAPPQQIPPGICGGNILGFVGLNGVITDPGAP